MTASSDLLIEAAARNDIEAVRKALENGASPDTMIDTVPILHIAAVNGQPELVDALLAAKANPNSRDADGRTALMYIAWLGYSDEHKHIFESLLEKGADVNATDGRGARALDLAARFFNHRTAGRLTALHAKCSPLAKRSLDMMEAGQSRST